MSYYVLYKVNGDRHRSGPYETLDDVWLHKQDIETYVDVTDAEIVTVLDD